MTGARTQHRQTAELLALRAVRERVNSVEAPRRPGGGAMSDRDELLVLIESIEIATDENGDGATLAEGSARRLRDGLTDWLAARETAAAAKALRDAANQFGADIAADLLACADRLEASDD